MKKWTAVIHLYTPTLPTILMSNKLQVRQYLTPYHIMHHNIGEPFFVRNENRWEGQSVEMGDDLICSST